MKKSISFIIIIILWQIAALLINRNVIMPMPLDVLSEMMMMLTSSSFYLAVSLTLFRVLISLIISSVLGIDLGIVSGLYGKVEDYLSPVISLLQTIPQIAFIIIFLVWFKSTTALILIILLMVLPIFYYNTLNGIRNIDSELMDVVKLYHHPLIYNVFKVYLPLIKGYLLSAFDSSIPLSLKIAVMAEIFVSSENGIGKQLYLARAQINMTGIFALTIWMIIIMQIILSIFKLYKKRS